MDKYYIKEHDVLTKVFKTNKTNTNFNIEHKIGVSDNWITNGFIALHKKSRDLPKFLREITISGRPQFTDDSVHRLLPPKLPEHQLLIKNYIHFGGRWGNLPIAHLISKNGEMETIVNAYYLSLILRCLNETPQMLTNSNYETIFFVGMKNEIMALLMPMKGGK